MLDSSLRSLIIHAGIHKTGTTSLQIALAENPAWLAARHSRFPLAGRKWNPGGHHNLAWEITGDRRFQPEFGTVEDVLKEVRDGGDDVILSTEDFTAAIAHPERFQSFINAFRPLFADICVVVFLRNQADYGASLYSEALFHGYTGTFQEFLHEIAATGVVRWHEWCFPFDYQMFLSRIRAIEGVRLAVRSYDLSKNELLPVFTEACGHPGEGLPPLALGLHNTRRSAGWCLAQFVRNRASASPDDAASRILTRLESAWASTPFTLSPEHREFFKRAFWDSNESVSAEYGIPLNSFMSAASEQSGSLQSGVFSSDSEALLKEASAPLGEELARTDALQAATRHLQLQLDSVQLHLDSVQLELDSARLSLQTEANRFQAAQAHSEHLLQKAKQQSEALTADLTGLEAKLIAKEAQLADNEARLAAAASANSVANAELRRLQLERDALIHEREMIFRSRSWLLTAPLRSFTRWLGLQKAPGCGPAPRA